MKQKRRRHAHINFSREILQIILHSFFSFLLIRSFSKTWNVSQYITFFLLIFFHQINLKIHSK